MAGSVPHTSSAKITFGRLGRIAAAAIAILALFPAGSAIAQLAPADRWYTLETEHFRVHFTKPLEAEARRGALNAEHAFARLATELVAPPGKVDLVIADNVDYVNGYASTFPSNRIVIFVNPPVDVNELRNYDDWSVLVITHELAHIFHLDRAGGIWRLGRSIFGRHPVLFPNVFQPAWVIEGLAVYYESRITGAGRLEGPGHYMIARAAAEAHRIPRLGELSRATTRFPGGETVYAYGGFVFDHLSRTRGPRSIADFIDVTSRSVFPLSLNGKAKRAFGITFENAWKQWSDSLVRMAPAMSPPLPGWRQLTTEGRYVSAPRWLGDTALVYSASTGREVTSAYTTSPAGRTKRIGRRNSVGPNVPLANGGILFSQLDYTDPFHIRNDLYVERAGRSTQLTKGARLTDPDARSDGSIVAVQATLGSTRIARVSSDGREIAPLTTGDANTQWAEPRWSPDGTRLAAVRLKRGGRSEIVVLDTAGGVIDVLLEDVAIVASPAWSEDGGTIFFTSTRSGLTQAYTIPSSGRAVATRLSSSSTGAFDPEPSPDSRSVAMLDFRFDGYHLGLAPLPDAHGENPDPIVSTLRPNCPTCRMVFKRGWAETTVVIGDTRRYSPWRSLLPRYWEPVFESSTENGSAFGAATSGYDIIGRHDYYVSASYNTRYGETHAFGAYSYGGLGRPYLHFTAEQAWEHFPLFNAARDEVGDLARQARTFGASAVFVRPKVRTFASFSAGGEIESRVHTTDPDTLLPRLPAIFGARRSYPSLFASGSWLNTSRPALAISREDGISVGATGRQRWQSGNGGGASRSIVGVMSAYRSLDLPGFAHHVIAIRGAAGAADERTITAFSAGGLSGGNLDVLAGVSVGDGARTFGIRGFPPSAEQGNRAFAGSLEYRAPVAAPSRRIPYIPIFFDRVSAAAFADAGRAYCPASADSTSVVCRSGNIDGPLLGSVGGELILDTAIQYDIPARLRAGLAVPVLNREAGRARSVSAYLTFGSSF